MKRDSIYLLIAFAIWLLISTIGLKPWLEDRIIGIVFGLMLPRIVRGTIESITELIATFKKTNQ